MNINQIYFHRNRGAWTWHVEFQLLSWAALWRADISIFSKICISLLINMQRVPGPFRMFTQVECSELGSTVRHSTQMKKWGFTIYRSEKVFALMEDGLGLRLTGKEFYWPLIFIGIPFRPTTGSVDPSTTRAFYRMPIAGTHCDCRALLEPPVGHLEIATTWMRGRLTLTADSSETLRARLKLSVSESDPNKPLY